MRKLIAAALLATAVAAPALADQRNFPVGGFESLASSGPWTVRVHTGAAPTVNAYGDKDVLDRLRIEVVGGELRIGTKPGSWFGGWHWNSSSHTRIDVTVPMLHGLAVSGPGDLTVDTVRAPAVAVRLSGPGDITVGTIDTKAIDIDLSGPGDIKLNGRAGNARVRLSGPGDIHGKGLTVGDVDISLSRGRARSGSMPMAMQRAASRARVTSISGRTRIATSTSPARAMSIAAKTLTALCHIGSLVRA